MRLAFSVETPDRIREGITRLAALIKRKLAQKGFTNRKDR
jgi:hypothetical protein